MSPSPREPVFNAPWPALLVSGGLVLLYATQWWWGGPQVFERYGLIPARVGEGRVAGLFTSLFVHGNWFHVLANAAFALPFGAAVARRFGSGTGVLLFFAFYLFCGLCAGLGYFVLHPDSRDVLVGASGAISGLVGGGARLLGPGRKLQSFTSPGVVGLTASMVIVNVLVAIVGVAPGSEDTVAWEAHLAGYAAGLLLIGVFVRLAPSREPILEPWAR